jgi:hypothetical protein
VSFCECTTSDCGIQGLGVGGLAALQTGTAGAPGAILMRSCFARMAAGNVLMPKHATWSSGEALKCVARPTSGKSTFIGPNAVVPRIPDEAKRVAKDHGAEECHRAGPKYSSAQKRKCGTALASVATGLVAIHLGIATSACA